MKLACLKRIVIGLILSNLLLNSFSQGIEKKTYHTSFTKTAPEIDGLMNDGIWLNGEVTLSKRNRMRTGHQHRRLYSRSSMMTIIFMYS
jgi:hypothetical protein